MRPGVPCGVLATPGEAEKIICARPLRIRAGFKGDLKASYLRELLKTVPV